MGQRITEVSGRSHQPQGRVRLPHDALRRRAVRTGGNNLTTNCYSRTPAFAGKLFWQMPAASMIFFPARRPAQVACTTEGTPSRPAHRYGPSHQGTLMFSPTSTQHFPRDLPGDPLSGCRRPTICCQLFTSHSVSIADDFER